MRIHRVLIVLLILVISVVGTVQAGDPSQLTFEGDWSEDGKQAVVEQVARPEIPALPNPIIVKLVEDLDGNLAYAGCRSIVTESELVVVLTHEYGHVYDCQTLTSQDRQAILDLNDVGLTWRAQHETYTSRPIERYAGTFAEFFGPSSYLNTQFQVLVPFTDLGDQPEEVQDAVVQLYELGITKGTSITTFSPERAVTRAEMAVFLARLYEELR